MQVTFLINSLTNGGAERVVLTLAEKFVAEGNEVKIISLNTNNAYTIPKGIEMVYLTDMDDSGSGIKRMLYIPYYAWKLRQYSKQHNLTLIQSHIFRSNYVNVLSTIMGAKHKTQLVNHSIASRYLSQGILGKFNLSLMRFFYPKADLLVSISHKMLNDLNELFAFRNKKIVIHNPYDIQRVITLANEPVDEFAFQKDRRYLVTVGRLIALKQFEDIISVLAKLPDDVELLMLGADGGEQRRLESLVLDLKLTSRVHFLGQVSNPFKFVKRCELFVSTSRTEGFPNVLIESMLCRTAIVSSDCISGPREILAPHTDIDHQLKDSIEKAPYGVLYPVGNLKCLEEAVKLLLEDKVLRDGYEEEA